MGGRLGLLLKDDRRWDWFTIAYVLLLLAGLSYNIRPGIAITDEVGYVLMVDSISHGTFRIWNGLGEYDSEELVIHPLVRHDGGLYGMPAQLYSVLALPFYLAFNVWGLVFVNTLCYVGTVLLVYLISKSLFADNGFSFFAAVVYTLPTYSMRYSLEVWPHMMSVFLVAAAFYITVRGEYLFLAGLVAGLSVGVRYPNMLLVGVLALYALARNGRRGFFALCAGALLPGLVIMLINNTLYGSVVRTGYHLNVGSERLMPSSDPGDSPYLFMVFMAFGLPYVLAHIFGGGGRALSIGLCVALFASAALFAVDASFPDKMWSSTRVVYAQLFDIQMLHRGEDDLRKMSLFQASPILSLSLLAPLLLRGRIGGRETALLFAPALVLLLLASSFHRYHGAAIFFTRYLIESMPFLAIAAAYTVKKLLKRGGLDSTISKVGLFVVIFMSLKYLRLASHSMSSVYLPTLPFLLTATLLSTGFICYLRGRLVKVVSLAIVLSLAYGVSVSLFDCILTKTMREGNIEIVGELDYVIDDSVLFLGDNLDVIDVGLLKVQRRVRIVDTSVDNQTDAGGILSFYNNRGIPAYIYDANETGYREFIESSLALYDHNVVEGEYGRVYVVEAER
jgi:hypothetical protein